MVGNRKMGKGIKGMNNPSDDRFKKLVRAGR